ncbi:hypothetical protein YASMINEVIRUS_720 [Yasminevirus sp. GU-2018]|uniref:Uncharacterized protein n=1 Tax=Yasminevirus sp. GU-2018 TaxID=2420051 RepID=A0A5K0U8N9_9VIRU|nr:hypothetical protein YASMINEVIRUS_720 [Yasminevirus sp. GU-2018]
MSTTSEASSKSSSKSKSRHHSDKRRQDGASREICIDNLFPSESKSGTRGRKMDINTLFSNTPLNPEPDITFTSDVLLDRIKKRRAEKLLCYMNMLKYCHKRIADADEDQGTDIILKVVETVPECKDYDPRECLEYISIKLREDDFDTTILTDTTMFITWKYLELKREDRQRKMEEAETRAEKEAIDDDDLDEQKPHKSESSSSKVDTGKSSVPISAPAPVKRTREITLTKSEGYSFM